MRRGSDGRGHKSDGVQWRRPPAKSGWLHIGLRFLAAMAVAACVVAAYIAVIVPSAFETLWTNLLRPFSHAEVQPAENTSPLSRLLQNRQLAQPQEFRRLLQPTPEEVCKRFGREGFENKGWRPVTLGSGYGCNSDALHINRAPVETRLDETGTSGSNNSAEVFFSARGQGAADLDTVRFQVTAHDERLIRLASQTVLVALNNVLSDLGTQIPKAAEQAFLGGEALDRQFGAIHWRILVLPRPLKTTASTQEEGRAPMQRHLILSPAGERYQRSPLFPKGL